MVAKSQGDLKYKAMAMASGGMDGGSDELWMNNCADLLWWCCDVI